MTRKAKRLLEWLERAPGGVLLESQVVGSGLSNALNELIRAGLARCDAHPTVTEGAPACPACGVFLVRK